MNRTDIITRYRDRIENHDRTKLTQDETQSLIESFIGQLREKTTADEIKALCDAEIALLEEGYPKSTIAKVLLPQYRKAIKTTMAEGGLPMNDETSRKYTFTKRNSGEIGEAHDHRALDFLKYDQETYSAIAGQSAERNNDKQDNLKPINPDVYVTKAAELLNSSDPFELAAGIAAVTGRRFSEVVAKGRIAATDHPYWINFSGQLKKKSEADSYLTPCLIPAATVITALKRFRKHPRIARLVGKTPNQINRSLADSVKRAVQRHFTGIVPTLEGEANVSIHNLRGVYAEICVLYFCPPSQGVARFLQERLGHVISREELKRGNATATQHYFHYYLVDSNGKHIGSRGVKLTDDGSLPTRIEPISEKQSKTSSHKRSTQQSELASAIAALTEQIQSLAQENQRIWEQIDTMQSTAPQTQNTPDTTFFTREIESLRSQLEAIQQERDQAITALEQTQIENESLKRQFEQERQAYQNRIAGLTELIKQAPPITQPTFTQTVQAVATTEEIDQESQPQTARVIQPTPKQKRIRNTGSADQKVETSMRAIMQWNYEHDSDRDKFALNQSILQKLTGSNMPAVKRVLEKFATEIQDHNQEFDLDPDRHNYGKDLSEIKNWVQSYFETHA